MRLLFILIVIGTIASPAHALPGRGFGHGRGTDDRHAADRDVFHLLLSNHEEITRTVTELANGVETLTESPNPEVAEQIKDHVRWMEHRIANRKPIRMRDPLFREIFQHTDKIKMEREETQSGVRVIETSDDAYVAQLIKAHAKTVSGFVEHGFEEARRNHPVPPRKVSEEPTALLAKEQTVTDETRRQRRIK